MLRGGELDDQRDKFALDAVVEVTLEAPPLARAAQTGVRSTDPQAPDRRRVVHTLLGRPKVANLAGPA